MKAADTQLLLAFVGPSLTSSAPTCLGLVLQLQSGLAHFFLSLQHLFLERFPHLLLRVLGAERMYAVLDIVIPLQEVLLEEDYIHSVAWHRKVSLQLWCVVVNT